MTLPLSLREAWMPTDHVSQFCEVFPFAGKFAHREYPDGVDGVFTLAHNRGAVSLQSAAGEEWGSGNRCKRVPAGQPRKTDRKQGMTAPPNSYILRVSPQERWTPNLPRGPPRCCIASTGGGAFP